MKKTHVWMLSVVFLCLVAGSALSQDLYVAPGGNNSDGSDWENAYTTIQTAIDAASAGQSIIVSNATYTLTAQIDLNKDVTVYSLTDAVDTIIDANGSGRVIEITDADAVLDGFTIQGGLTADNDGSGGGVKMSAGLVRNCIITNNVAFDDFGNPTGGGVYMTGGTLRDSSAVDNETTGKYANHKGGGVYVSGGALVTNCTISANRVYDATDLYQPYGGGAYILDGTVVDCTISDNTASRKYNNAARGGGAYLAHADALLDRCVVTGNEAANISGTGQQGGGVYMEDGTVRSCLIAGNESYELAGGVHMTGGTLESSTIVRNEAANDEYGGVYRGGGTVLNCIVYYNVADGAVDNMTNDTSVTYSCSPALTSGTGNTTDAPSFLGAGLGSGLAATLGDYHLDTMSTLVDAGSNEAWMDSGRDLDGEARKQGATVDIGAYEGADAPIIPYTLYVAPGGDNSDGSTWAKAFTTISNAIENAIAGRTIIVSNATYTLTSQIDLNKGVTVESLTDAVDTIIDANGSGRVIEITDSDAVLDGFTVTGGLLESGEGCGIKMSAGEVRNCVVTNNNKTAVGGSISGCGVYMSGGSLRDSTVADNTISMRYAAAYGAGLYVSGGALVTNCTVSGNTHSTLAESSGGYFGGGVYLVDGTVVDCTISNNIVYNGTFGGTYYVGSGGGVYMAHADAMLDRCVIIGNSAVDLNEQDKAYGGGVYIAAGTVRNCLVAGNESECEGGGVYMTDGVLESSTIVHNEATDVDHGGVYRGGGTVLNCIVYYNSTAGSVANIALDGSVTYSCAPELTSGSGNMTDAPSFVGAGLGSGLDATLGDYHLDTMSTLVDAGSNVAWMDSGTDLDGEARKQGGTVDIGAYEGADAPIIPYTLYVAPGGDNSDGSTWAKAFTTISNAIENAIAGRTIIVSNATYTITSPIDLNKGVTVESLTDAEDTIIDANGSGRVIEITDADAVLDGFTIQGGLTADNDGSGGGVKMSAGLVRNCIITNNVAFDDFGNPTGGGVYMTGGTLRDSSAVDNETTGKYANHKGGGVYVSGGALVTNCTISANRVYDATDLYQPYGGGAYILDGTVVDCTISDNTASRKYINAARGGGAYLAHADALLDRCVVTGNEAANISGTGQQGGGVYMEDGTVRSCLIAGNESYELAGGVYMTGGTLESSTIVRNEAANDDYGGVYRGGGTVLNCVVGDNASAGSVANIALDGSVTYSCAPELTSGTGNTTDSPSFQSAGLGSGLDATLGDYHLDTMSTLVNAGSNVAWMDSGMDLDGEARKQGGTVDIGAYEGADAPIIPYTLYVAPGGDNSDGSTWAKAFTTISYAIENAIAGRTIIVSNATYTLTSQIDLSKGVTVESLTDAVDTIIDANGSGRVISITDADAVLEGFTLQNGTYDNGGGVYMSGGEVRNCVVKDNITDQSGNSSGGGVYMVGGTLRDSTVSGNQADPGNSSDGYGGGLYVAGAAAVVSNCTISGNLIDGPDPDGFGGGVYVAAGSVVDCTISNNVIASFDTVAGVKESKGAGVYMGGSGAMLDRCTVVGNYTRKDWAGDGDDVRYGGGVYMADGTVRNCLIAGNEAHWQAGGVYMTGGTLESSTIVRNEAANDEYGGVYRGGGTVLNCIIYNNDATAGSVNDIADHAAITYSCAPGLTGTGTVTGDPQFEDAGSGAGLDAVLGSYRLSTGSPCLQQGSNQGWMSGALELDGRARLIGTVDMGAYERPNAGTLFKFK